MSVECVGHLGFHRPLTSQVKESLVVRNPHNRPVAFKIKTTAPKQYCVRPNSGRIEPGQEVEVQVLLQAMKEEPPVDFKCRDKFLVQSTIIAPEHESSSISVLWSAIESKSRDAIHEKKIRCLFLTSDSSEGNNYMETSHGSHGLAHESSEAGPAPAYHVAETSTTEPQKFSTVSSQYPVTERSNLFQVEPALPNLPSGSNSGLSVQLDEAKRKIEKLQQQVDSATSRSKVDSKMVHNEGVPVPLTALIALIAFMAAYLLF